MDEKRALYFLAGAREVWLCGVDGKMDFYQPGVDGVYIDEDFSHPYSRQLDNSQLCPQFPHQV